MIKKFQEATSLLMNNFKLISAIILTVWLPGNILANLIYYSVDNVSAFGSIKLLMWIEAIFGPIYIGALIYALSQIKQSHSVSYKDAISVGFKKWGSLFAARFVAGLLILLGLIALIIPGIMLLVRYAFLEQAVVLENKGVSDSRQRSVFLTTGRRWQIFGAGVLFWFTFLVFSFVIYLPLGLFESLNLMPLEIALDCLCDIVFSIIQIVIFLFYWDAVKTETMSKQPTDVTDNSIGVIRS